MIEHLWSLSFDVPALLLKTVAIEYTAFSALQPKTRSRHFHTPLFIKTNLRMKAAEGMDIVYYLDGSFYEK